MKCDTCKGKGVVPNVAATYGVAPCPECDLANLQLRLDHKFQPVVERMEDTRELSPTQQRIEDIGTEPNPIYHDIPFMPAGGSLQNQDWTPGRFNVVPMAPSEQKSSGELELMHPHCQKRLQHEGMPTALTCRICEHGPCRFESKVKPKSIPVSKVTPLKMEPPTAVQEFVAGAKDRAAVRTLQKLGYTYNEGSEHWKPPLGPAPQSRDEAIAQVRAEFAKAGLCIVPVDDIESAIRYMESYAPVHIPHVAEFVEVLRKHLPKEDA